MAENEFRKLDHMTVFTDIGEHYVCGAVLGAVNDYSLVHTKNGTHVSTSREGYLQTFFQCDGTQTGTKVINSDLITATCAALRMDFTADGAEDEIAVLGSTGLDAYVIRQSGETMLPPEKLALAVPPEAVSLVRYVPLQTGDGYKIAVIYKNRQDDGCSIGYFEWKQGQVLCAQNTGLYADTQDVYWVKNMAGDDVLLFQSDGEFYTEYPLSDTLSTRKKIHDSRAQKLVYAFGNQYLTLSEDGVVSAVPVDGADAVSLWHVETGVKDISKFCAVMAYGYMQLFLYSKEKRVLYHCPITDALGDAGNDCIPLEDDVLDYRLEQSGEGVWLAVLRGSKDTPRLYRYTLSDDGKNWTQEEICLASEQDFQKINGHIIDITLHDNTNAVLNDATMLLWAAENVTVRVGGNVLRLDAQHKYSVHPDAMGRIELVMETDTLDGVELILCQADAGGALTGNYFVISPGEKYKNTLYTASAETLLTARTCQGELLVPQDLQGRGELVQTACDASKNMLQGAFLEDNEKLQEIRVKTADADADNEKKVSVYVKDPTPFLRGSAPAPALKSCIVRFENGNICYRQVSEQEAACRMRVLHGAVYGKVRAFHDPLLEDGFFSSIASVFKAIAKGLVEVAEIVVNAVEQGIQAAVHFIRDEIQSVVTFALDKAKDALHLVESVLLKIKVGIEKVIQWIGFLFDWKDIVRTAEHISGLFDSGIAALSDGIDGFSKKVDAGLGTVEKNIQDYFKKMRMDTPSDDKLAFARETPQDSAINQADAHNIVKKHLGSQMDGNQMLFASDRAVDADGIFSELLDAASVFELQLPDGFADVFTIIKNGECSLKAVVNGFADLLDGLLTAALEAVRKGAAAFLGILKCALSALRDIIEQPIHIPILTPLIKLCTGMDLTIQNLVSFLVAVPATIAYKLMYNETPCDGELTKGAVNNWEKVLLTFAGVGYAFCKGMTDVIMCKTISPTSFAAVKLCGIVSFFALVVFASVLTAKKVDGSSVLFCIFGAAHMALDIAVATQRQTSRRAFFNVKLMIAIVMFVFEIIFALLVHEKAERLFFFPGGVFDMLAEVMTCVSCDQHGQIRDTLMYGAGLIDGAMGVGTVVCIWTL